MEMPAEVGESRPQLLTGCSESNTSGHILWIVMSSGKNAPGQREAYPGVGTIPGSRFNSS